MSKVLLNTMNSKFDFNYLIHKVLVCLYISCVVISNSLNVRNDYPNDYPLWNSEMTQGTTYQKQNNVPTILVLNGKSLLANGRKNNLDMMERRALQDENFEFLRPFETQPVGALSFPSETSSQDTSQDTSSESEYQIRNSARGNSGNNKVDWNQIIPHFAALKSNENINQEELTVLTSGATLEDVLKKIANNLTIPKYENSSDSEKTEDSQDSNTYDSKIQDEKKYEEINKPFKEKPLVKNENQYINVHSLNEDRRADKNKEPKTVIKGFQPIIKDFRNQEWVPMNPVGLKNNKKQYDKAKVASNFGLPLQAFSSTTQMNPYELEFRKGGHLFYPYRYYNSQPISYENPNYYPSFDTTEFMQMMQDVNKRHHVDPTTKDPVITKEVISTHSDEKVPVHIKNEKEKILHPNLGHYEKIIEEHPKCCELVYALIGHEPFGLKEHDVFNHKDYALRPHHKHLGCEVYLPPPVPYFRPKFIRKPFFWGK